MPVVPPGGDSGDQRDGDDSGPESASPGRSGSPVGRRAFVKALALAGVGVPLGAGTLVTNHGRILRDPALTGALDRVDDLPAERRRPWLGAPFWANRLQDWRLRDGRIECLTGEAGDEVRTVSLLTRSLAAGTGTAHLRVRVGLAGGDAPGFCGFLFGVGDPSLDYRAAALCGRSAGTGGGTLATFGTDGRVRFRDHESESRPLEFAELDAATRVGPAGPRSVNADAAYRLSLDVLPQGNGRFTVHLAALDGRTVLSQAVRRNVPESSVRGGLALVSSPPPGEAGARWWFEDVRAGGSKVASRPGRSFGPFAGTLYSLADDGLRLTAQLLPVVESEWLVRGAGDGSDVPDDAPAVRFRYRPADDAGDRPWRDAGESSLEPGYVARFHLEDWDASRAWEFEVSTRLADGPARERGVVRADPALADHGYPGEADAGRGGDETVVGLVSCTRACAVPLDGGDRRRRSGSRDLGRYTDANLYFPHAELAGNLERHDPDLLVFAGDQLYEASPTRPVDRPDPGLDYLYKWYLWCWSFRDLTRDRPTVVLVDDHDVYQSNLWGEGGESAARGRFLGGGYAGSPAFVNLVQRTQCGHDPTYATAAPAERDIDTYYGSFGYGGVEFALLEDRKFKSGPPRAWKDGPPPAAYDLLGERQERFLREWGDEDGQIPRVCLSQTTLAAVQTGARGLPVTDFDANGFPKAGRDRAVRLLADAGALVLSGDQHFGTLLRHGLDDQADGVVQFNGPAGAATFQRWFDPDERLPNARGTCTGDWTDAFGNPVRVLAVANPRVGFDALRGLRGGWSHWVGARERKREGYGVVRIDREREAFVLECWPWDADPAAADTRQYPGWPYRLGFDEVAGDPDD